MDRLNDIAYSYRFSNLDSAEVYAKRALSSAQGYADGEAEALNNMAFVNVMRMDYDSARVQLDAVGSLTDNQVELLMADVGLMQVCQRMSLNKEFYDYRHQALLRMSRIGEERDELPERLMRRMTSAEALFAIVSADYFRSVGLNMAASKALETIDANALLTADTALYASFLQRTVMGEGLSLAYNNADSQSQLETLVASHMMSLEDNYAFCAARPLLELAEMLAYSSDGAVLLADNRQFLALVVGEGVDDYLVPLTLAEMALRQLSDYGSNYDVASAWRTLAICHIALGEYQAAIECLETALSDPKVAQAPDLVASIREQMSVACSGLDDKQASDYNRNIYLDLQEQTRQDRYFESRAQLYDKASALLGVMMAAVIAAIVVLVLLLWLFSYLNRKRNTVSLDDLLLPLSQWQERNERATEALEQRREAISEQQAASRERLRTEQRRSVENRAKVSLATDAMPLVGRMVNEIEMLARRNEPDDVRRQRYDYVAELAGKIDEYNAVLTHWVKLRQGMLSLHVETFALKPLFDIVAKSRMVFASQGIELNVAETQLCVKADKALTLFMINTLADNARKFTPRGGTVTIGAIDADDYVEISVADMGVGIPADRLPHIFDYKTGSDHGFGLVNCRGIIEQYRKTSRIFAVCQLNATSTEGQGSRFAFRLPKGVVRTLAAILSLFGASSAFAASADSLISTRSDLSLAKAYADSAYFSNIAGTYDRTLAFADSCLTCLNNHSRTVGREDQLALWPTAGGGQLPVELEWLADSVPTNYNIILDIRNESAVAALALHDWPLYHHNNQAYTQLFKAMSADHSLPDYCRSMQQSQSNKAVAVIVLVLMLVSILPAYYLLYYRHKIYFRHCVDRVGAINRVLLSDAPADVKLRLVDKLLTDPLPDRLQSVVDQIRLALSRAAEASHRREADIELASDELRRVEHDAAKLHVANAVLDNCLSALKHETMYYPGRILQLVEGRDAELATLRELVAYYRDVYLLLCRQAALQQPRALPRVTNVAVSRLLPDDTSGLVIVGNANTLDYLLSTLRRHIACNPFTAKPTDDGRYVVLTATTSAPLDSQAPSLFTPSTDNLPMMLCRQIVRDHSEATGRRRCGIVIRPSGSGSTVEIILPRAIDWRANNRESIADA